MPQKSWPLWLWTALLLLALPILNIIYWDGVLHSGVLPSDGDSVAIPMFGGIIFTLKIAPFVLLITWVCLWRYNPVGKILAWRTDRPIRSIASTTVFGTVSIAIIVVLVLDARWGWPWYEYMMSLYIALWLPWLFGLRAALIEQLPTK